MTHNTTNENPGNLTGNRCAFAPCRGDAQGVNMMLKLPTTQTHPKLEMAPTRPERDNKTCVVCARPPMTASRLDRNGSSQHCCDSCWLAAKCITPACVISPYQALQQCNILSGGSLRDLPCPSCNCMLVPAHGPPLISLQPARTSV